MARVKPVIKLTVWKDICIIPEYAEFTNYEISSTGLVRNKTTQCISKPCINKISGYLQTGLWQKPYRKTIAVHRLLALLFIENIDNKELVDHVNGNKTDNRLDNIRWVSQSENAMNSKIRSHNTSGYKNILLTYNRQRKPIWKISVTTDKKIRTKTFKRNTEEPPPEVIKCRDKMLKDLHKDFACFRI